MKIYRIYYSFDVEYEDIEIAEKEAHDIANGINDSRIRNLDITVRETSR